MSDKQQALRRLALEMVQAGGAMMKSGAEVLAEYGQSELGDVKERAKNELSEAALTYRGLRIDHVPQRHEYEFFWQTESAPFLVMDDRETLAWAGRGHGALTLKVESYLMEESEKREQLENRPAGEGQE